MASLTCWGYYQILSIGVSLSRCCYKFSVSLFPHLLPCVISLTSQALFVDLFVIYSVTSLVPFT